VLELNASNAVINRFSRGGGGRLLRSEHHSWYLHNARGDVVMRVDDLGVVLHVYHYDAFGVEREQDDGNTNPFRFAGEYYDWETGTIYLRARNYNPRTGRFTQEDPFWHTGNMQNGPLAIMQAANLYMYTVHNPVRWIDPSGLSLTVPLRTFAESHNADVRWVRNYVRAGRTYAEVRITSNGMSTVIFGQVTNNTAMISQSTANLMSDFFGWNQGNAQANAVQIGGHNYVFPVDIETNTRIDWYHRGGRDAVDIFAPEGILVFAITSGTLIRVQNDVSRAAGNRATLQLLGDDGMIYFHTHLAPNSPSEFGFDTVGSGGTVRVEAGQPIGRIGNWGAADNTPPHLHISATPVVGANAPVDQHVGNWTRTLVGQLLG